MLLLALVLLAALWELYKLVIPDDGVRVGDALILPRSDDTSMPHLSRDLRRPSASRRSRGRAARCWSSVVSAVWYSLRLAAAGFAIGVVVGFLLALAMQRLRIVERALLPYVVLSQTVPLIALAPLVYGWSGNLTLFGLDWQPWMSVSAIAAYLAFFPVASARCAGCPRRRACRPSCCAATRRRGGRRSCGCGCPRPCPTSSRRSSWRPRRRSSARSWPRSRSACPAASGG